MKLGKPCGKQAPGVEAKTCQRCHVNKTYCSLSPNPKGIARGANRASGSSARPSAKTRAAEEANWREDVLSTLKGIHDVVYRSLQMQAERFQMDIGADVAEPEGWKGEE